MLNIYYLLDVITDLINATEDAINWANTVGIAIIASIMAIALIKFLYDR